MEWVAVRVFAFGETKGPLGVLSSGAEDEGRTRDLRLGKATHYHCATSAGLEAIIDHGFCVVNNKTNTSYLLTWL